MRYQALSAGEMDGRAAVGGHFKSTWIIPKRDPQFPAGLFSVVRMARVELAQAYAHHPLVELAQAYAHHPLKVACLPFHHIRFWFGTAKIH